MCRDEKKDGTTFLEVDASLAAKKPDIYNVVTTNRRPEMASAAAVTTDKHPSSGASPAVQCDSNTDDDFTDDPDVPPLI